MHLNHPKTPAWPTENCAMKPVVGVKAFEGASVLGYSLTGDPCLLFVPSMPLSADAMETRKSKPQIHFCSVITHKCHTSILTSVMESFRIGKQYPT